MKAFFDSIAHGFEAVGLHPVLGAFIVGAVIAFIFARRSSADVADIAAHKLPAASLPMGASFKSNVTLADKTSLTIDERSVELPAEVLAQIRAGNKIEPIKALRAATGVDLKTAKEIVDKIAASPMARQ